MAFDGQMVRPAKVKRAPLTKRRRRALDALARVSGHSRYDLAVSLSAYTAGLAKQGLAPRNAGLEHALDRIAACLESDRHDVLGVR